MSAKIDPTGFEWHEADITSAPEITVLTEQDTGTAIQTFDVSTQNWTAVGFSNSCISIFDENCIPVRHYDLDISGVYHLEWENDLLWVHILRYEQSICISSDGEIVSCATILDTENSYAYWEYLRSRKEITMNGITYQEANNTLTRTAPDGTETIIVSTADEVKLTNRMTGLLVGFMFLLFIIIFVICVSERKGTKGEEEYPLSLRGFMQIRSDLWADHRKKTKNHSHSPKTYDELYTTRKEDHYENN